MKKLKQLRETLILIGICLFYTCNSSEYHKVTISIDRTCSPEQQQVAYDVINKRVSAIWHVKEKTDLKNGMFDLTYSGEDSLLTQILTQKGEIFITEMYSNADIQSALSKVYERLIWLIDNTDQKPIWKINSLQNSDFLETSSLISAPLQQTSYTDSIFNSYKKRFFPSGISFAWTAKSEEGYFDLLPLKPSSQPFSLNPSSVKSCKLENRQFSDEDDTISYQEIFVTLKEDYSNEWAILTRNNTRKNLAIVMDGKVLMYPRVQSEITGGKLGITGNFEHNEYLLIKSAIEGGVLECEAQIINQ